MNTVLNLARQCAAMNKRHVILSKGGSRSEGSLIRMWEEMLRFAQHDMRHHRGESI
jgi:hypothetical protein